MRPIQHGTEDNGRACLANTGNSAAFCVCPREKLGEYSSLSSEYLLCACGWSSQPKRLSLRCQQNQRFWQETKSQEKPQGRASPPTLSDNTRTRYYRHSAINQGGATLSLPPKKNGEVKRHHPAALQSSSGSKITAHHFSRKKRRASVIVLLVVGCFREQSSPFHSQHQLQLIAITPNSFHTRPTHHCSACVPLGLDDSNIDEDSKAEEIPVRENHPIPFLDSTIDPRSLPLSPFLFLSGSAHSTERRDFLTRSVLSTSGYNPIFLLEHPRSHQPACKEINPRQQATGNSTDQQKCSTNTLATLHHIMDQSMTESASAMKRSRHSISGSDSASMSENTSASAGGNVTGSMANTTGTNSASRSNSRRRNDRVVDTASSVLTESTKHNSLSASETSLYSTFKTGDSSAAISALTSASTGTAISTAISTPIPATALAFDLSLRSARRDAGDTDASSPIRFPMALQCVNAFPRLPKHTYDRDHPRESHHLRWKSAVRQLLFRVLLGGVLGGMVSFFILQAILSINPQALAGFMRAPCPGNTCSAMSSPQETPMHHTEIETSGIMSYLSLSRFGRNQRDYHAQSAHSQFDSNRLLETQDTERIKLPYQTLKPIQQHQHPHSRSKRQLSSPPHDPELVIAGKMSVEDAPCNIAQLNLRTNKWSLTQRIQLSLYNSYSGGEVYSLLANHTNGGRTEDKEDQESYHSNGSGELVVVGAFDTTYRNSQVTYCSVGKWNGMMLSKVGEGLCNSALSKGMKITTVALAGPQDVYVAGSFQTQVWNGDLHKFVKIFNIAHFNAVDQMWSPLQIGQITCSWCTVTVLALAWDPKRDQLHVAGKFNSIDGCNVPAGLAIYDRKSGHLVAHPGGGLSMKNTTQDGVGTALQLDAEAGVLYVMGSFERLTKTNEICLGLAAYEIARDTWTCLADDTHTVQPTGGGNMLLTPYGLMVAGKTTDTSTWPDASRPYTIALLNATSKSSLSPLSQHSKQQKPYNYDFHDDDSTNDGKSHDFQWSWLPGFEGHEEPLHALTNGFGDYYGTVFIAGDDLVAKWTLETKQPSSNNENNRVLESLGRKLGNSNTGSKSEYVPVTEVLSTGHVTGAVMTISQMMPEPEFVPLPQAGVNVTIIIYCVAAGCVIGMLGAILCNRNLSSAIFKRSGSSESHLRGISLDTLTYSAVENSDITQAYERAMRTRYVHHPHLLTIINPQEIFLQRIIGEGNFGRVWSAKWRSSNVAVKEFVFAQAAVAGRSCMQREIIEEIIGEAGMMAMLRHPNVLHLFGCSLTAQAIWIVSELCSLGSLRQLLDDDERSLPEELRLNIALQVAAGMTYLHNQDPPIIHRDLKSHNIFVHETPTESEHGKNDSEDMRNGASKSAQWAKPSKMSAGSTIVAKIGDWGSARATLSGSRTMTHSVGTACWLAPEVIKHARSSKYSDVYGYGIVLWELATREEVYQGLETTQIIAKVANDNLRPPVPEKCPWKNLMVQCWEEAPQDRLDFNEIVLELNHLIDQVDDKNRSPRHYAQPLVTEHTPLVLR